MQKCKHISVSGWAVTKAEVLKTVLWKEMKSEQFTHLPMIFLFAACYLWIIWHKTVGRLLEGHGGLCQELHPSLWSSQRQNLCNTSFSQLILPHRVAPPPLLKALDRPYLGLAPVPAGNTGLLAPSATVLPGSWLHPYICLLAFNWGRIFKFIYLKFKN